MLAVNNGGGSKAHGGHKVKKENNTRAKIDKMRNLLRYIYLHI
jgi:hypothetical protein